MDTSDALALLRRSSPSFWDEFARLAAAAESAAELLLLAGLRRKARNIPRANAAADRLAFLGGYVFHPLTQLVQVCLDAHGVDAETIAGSFDNYHGEIMQGSPELLGFRPGVAFLAPSHRRCRYEGGIGDPVERQRESAHAIVDEIHSLSGQLHELTGADVLLANFPLPPHHDVGEFRCRTLGSDWAFRKLVNLELGLSAPRFVRICDLEFLSARLGGLTAEDPAAWFESKQLGSPALLIAAAREIARLVTDRRRPMRKVLVLDLDNTLWGGVVGDDGLEGIEIGDTSPRGEAFRSFQSYVRSLKDRGVLLGVCSKNDHARAVEPFERHPEMVLRMDDFAVFKANWQPKSENLRAIAAELNVGIDSLVMVDDNPAEIEIVRQFVPEAATVLLGPDPAHYVAQLADSRFFEPQQVTDEDMRRSSLYRAEALRRQHASAVTDMDEYLASLRMIATVSDFVPLDFPRIAQLVARSNQFNLTTRRRTEAEIEDIASSSNHHAFTVRLADRFGDHGLIAVVIMRRQDETMLVDTWLMSCRVLSRQVEELTVNEIVARTCAAGCTRIEGQYIPSPKNGMVRDLYPRMGFRTRRDAAEGSFFDLAPASFTPFTTHITVLRHGNEPTEHTRPSSAGL